MGNNVNSLSYFCAMTTKEKIIESAKLLFMKHGFEGVRMQMVADEAGVNKGLLHYYYKTKAAIFKEVFNRVSSGLFANLEKIFSDNILTIDQKISMATDAYFNIISQNRYVPVFIISEMNRQPKILKELGFDEKVRSIIQLAGKSFSMDKSPDLALHFFLTLISLSAFPFMVTPLLNEATGDNKKTEQLIMERKELVKKTLKNMLA